MSVRDVVSQRREESEPEVLATMEFLGQRWVIRIVWELEPGALGFLELRRRMGNCSSSVLAARLAMLVEKGVVRKLADKQYELTSRGEALGRALWPVWDWAREN
ncbi:helix-turn-helix domain-containing protein [Tsukamurella sp. 1534]|uniref:winged helix-turn-helix transcriptional regulator n=1 Tax=Tsukamurella sp. 1534 TaxID=1151061 RepID=UPI0002F4790C|nr:helix-turn-helix domain-containing protein [Tsukamurella sp. 1534]